MEPLLFLLLIGGSFAVSGKETQRKEIDAFSQNPNCSWLSYAHAHLNAAARMCGVYGTSTVVNNITVSYVYSFFGQKETIPKRVTMHCIPSFDCSREINTTSVLNYKINSTISDYKDKTIFYKVVDVEYLFICKKELIYFNCSESVDLNKLVSYKEANCQHPFTKAIQQKIDREFSSYTEFIGNTVKIAINSKDITFVNEGDETCEGDLLSILGVFVALLLVIGFIFLISYGCSKGKKPQYYGNGINVKNIKTISKPFSCGVNPYSKSMATDSKEEAKVVSTVEIPIISITPGGARSSTFVN